MGKKLKSYLTIALGLLMISVPVLVPASSLAVCSNTIESGVANGVTTVTNGAGSNDLCGGNDIQSGIKSVAVKVVNILSIVVGIVAVIMLIYGGFRYITSGGASGGVESAKNTLIYAIAGLVLVALAQVIVHWVLNTSSTISNAGGFIRWF